MRIADPCIAGASQPSGQGGAEVPWAPARQPRPALREFSRELSFEQADFARQKDDPIIHGW